MFPKKAFPLLSNDQNVQTAVLLIEVSSEQKNSNKYLPEVAAFVEKCHAQNDAVFWGGWPRPIMLKDPWGRRTG